MFIEFIWAVLAIWLCARVITAVRGRRDLLSDLSVALLATGIVAIISGLMGLVSPMLVVAMGLIYAPCVTLLGVVLDK